MTDPNLPAARTDDGDERQRASLLSAIGDVRDVLARDFADEVFAHRLAAGRKALDVAVAAVDALYTSGKAGLSEEYTRLLGGRAAAETAGLNPDDVNVATPVGSKEEAAPGLPNPNDRVTVEPVGVNPPAEAAPGNMTTDPEANPRLKDQK